MSDSYKFLDFIQEIIEITDEEIEQCDDPVNYGKHIRNIKAKYQELLKIKAEEVSTGVINCEDESIKVTTTKWSAVKEKEKEQKLLKIYTELRQEAMKFIDHTSDNIKNLIDENGEYK